MTDSATATTHASAARRPHRHRHVRGRALDGRQGPRGPRLVRGRQPARRRCCAPLTELADRAGEKIPKIATVVDVRGGRFFTDPEQAVEQAPREHVRAGPGAVPRGHRRRPRPALRAGPATAPAPGRGHPARRHRPRARPAGRAPRGVRRDHRHLRPQHPPAREHRHRDSSPTTDFVGRPGHADELRLQVRAARRRRHGGRRAVPPEPATGCRNSGRTPASTQPVSDYVLAQAGARPFVDRYASVLEPVLDGYQRENKRHATIAIGCTGGKHRSVAIVAELANLLRGMPGVAVRVKNRDLGRE